MTPVSPSNPSATLRESGRLVSWGLVVACLGACAGPRPEPEGKLARLQEILAEGQAIEASVVEGAEPLDADAFALADPEAVKERLAKDQPPAEGAVPQDDLPIQQNPYIRFGERIIVRSGIGGQPFITKPYTVPTGKALKLVELIDALEPFLIRAKPKPDKPGDPVPPLDPGIVEYQILPDWDTEVYTNLDATVGGKPPSAPAPVKLSDVMVVTASYNLLEQFEEFLDLFAAGGVPQIELEAKIIEVVETDQLDIGVSSSIDYGDKSFIQGIDFNLPNIASGTEALLSLGAVQSSYAFNAMIEAIRTWDNVQIDSRPKTVVRAGGVAYIESTTEFPFSEIKSINTNGDFTANTVYKKVGVQLYISPRIMGTKMLALDVHLVGSQQVGSQTTLSSSNGQVIEVPVIAARTARTMVYLEPGQTLVIGGLTSQRDREFVSKIPILGDLPLLGVLFRSRFTRAEKQHVLFAISPRILQNSDFETEF